MARIRHFVLKVFLLNITVVAAYVEELDGTFKETRLNEPWLVEFYAPWCDYCKVFESVWYEVGAELKSLGSPVNVGKIDTTVHNNVASEFGIRGYPTIKLFKGDQSFDYKGPRTKDAIIDFTNRVAGPIVRPLTSPHLFQHVMSRHDLFFVYIGGESSLKEEYLKVAAEYIVYIHFFSAPENILPKAVTLQGVPTVAVFKDGTYYLYSEYEDGDLSAWVNRERFLGYQQMDSFTLYHMGETSKLVALAVVDEMNPSEESIRYKTLMERIATEYRNHYNREFQFGYMNGNAYINGLVMGEVLMPSIIALNLSNDGYYLPKQQIETLEDLVQFLDSILDGTAQLLGGNGFFQQIHRTVYNAKSTLMSMFQNAPGFVCLLLSLPLGLVVFVLYGICTAVPDDSSQSDSSPLLLQSHSEDTQGATSAEQKAEEQKSSEAKKED
ncbi:protein disulfide-isomerase tmx3a [Chanos chanos]|uniref:Protein disulfide-isomerase TMX3 n=1 Tax=Chanos chanos TaxID=29144 RepID=A0A6J2VGX0_CHACN|nr:protein disulfide-isomerase TMX3-like [Chanos chanos]